MSRTLAYAGGKVHNMEELTVRAVAFETLEDLNTFGVFLAENQDGTGERLEIQRALEFDEQDHDLGMDTYCLCVSSGATHYGGVASYHIEGEYLTMHLEDEAAASLGVDNGIRFKLEVPSETVQRLAPALTRALGF